MSKQYMFLEDSESLVGELFNKYLTNGGSGGGAYAYSQIYNKVRKAYEMYYGRHFQDIHSEYGIGTEGEQGEYSSVTINHMRALIKTQYSMLTQDKTTFDAQAENTDTKSRNATIVANLVLDQYFDEKQIENTLNDILELGLVTSTAYAYVHWDTDEGKPVGVDTETGAVIKSGEVKVERKSIFDVFVEPWQDDWKKQQWCVVREMANRYDLMDIFPEFEQELRDAPSIRDLQQFEPFYRADNDDYIFLYKAYHKHTHALPDGRQTWFLDDSVVLFDELESPYEELPVIKFVPDTIYGSNYGHCPAFDLTPVQEAYGLLESSILTNQENFAVQNVIAPRHAGVNSTEISGGLNLVEYDADPDMKGSDAPKPLNLLATPPEVFNQSKSYISYMEQISGINEVTRGKAGANVTSGTMAAVLASASQNFLNATEKNFIRLKEMVATRIIKLLAEFMTEEELLTYTGKSQVTAVQSFKGQDLQGVKHVKIQVGNPLGKSVAGRLEAAQMMLSQGLLKSPQEFLEVITTGSLQNTLEEGTAEMNLIQRENEMMSEGESPVVSALDNHQEHVASHRQLIMRPEIRSNPEKLQAALNHIEQHLTELDNLAYGNPMLLALALGQPLPMPQPDPATGFGGEAAPAPGAEGGMSPEGGSPEDLAQAEGELEQMNATAEQQAADKMQEAENLFNQ